MDYRMSHAQIIARYEGMSTAEKFAMSPAEFAALHAEYANARITESAISRRSDAIAFGLNHNRYNY
jgi:hypothetical protein